MCLQTTWKEPKVAEKALKELQEEFEQYKKESIKWSVEDFLGQELDGYSITEEQAQEALEDMIHNHDCTIGITWETIDYYIEEHGKKVPEGKEAWRKYNDNQ